jgi:hypothetical protein
MTQSQHIVSKALGGETGIVTKTPGESCLGFLAYLRDTQDGSANPH